jgi:prepilin-type processing-associated H-X9-DG protein
MGFGNTNTAVPPDGCNNSIWNPAYSSVRCNAGSDIGSQYQTNAGFDPVDYLAPDGNIYTPIMCFSGQTASRIYDGFNPKTKAMHTAKTWVWRDMDGCMYGDSEVNFGGVDDGLSNTIVVGEATSFPDMSKDSQQFGCFYIGQGYAVGYTRMPDGTSQNAGQALTSSGIRHPGGGNNFVNGNIHSVHAGTGFARINAQLLQPEANGRHLMGAFGSWHPAGANFVYGDGSVKFLPNEINYLTWRGLFSRDSGQTTTAF